MLSLGIRLQKLPLPGLPGRAKVDKVTFAEQGAARRRSKEEPTAFVPWESRDATDDEEDEEDEDGSDVECSDEDEEDAADWQPPPETIEEASELAEAVLERLVAQNIPRVTHQGIKFGKEIGEGAFGTVKLASVAIGSATRKQVAVKTVVATGKTFHERLQQFETEAEVGWTASHAGNQDGKISRVCATLGIAVDITEGTKRQGIRVNMHILMERVDGRDMHEEIQDDRNWSYLRRDGEDTGSRLRTNFVVHRDNDTLAYHLPRSVKVHYAMEMARMLAELQRANILHCDLKPANILLEKTFNDKPSRSKPTMRIKGGKKARPTPTVASGLGHRLKVIDFGEGNPPEKAIGFVAGTPAYQAPEVAEDGECSFKSDMYSAGVSMIEVWTGQVWFGAETRGEGQEGTEMEIENALKKIAKAEPHVASILRRTIAADPAKRPSARKLLNQLRALRFRPVVQDASGTTLARRTNANARRVPGAGRV
mmetsp:Transcript_26378/g.62987  ORF Transcript_26378/g.62987 Transcript_26378/m.62987 type:complete len:482 (-) Transcript_26378:17-1462(-)